MVIEKENKDSLELFIKDLITNTPDEWQIVKYRGLIIHVMTELERSMDEFIAVLTCGKDHENRMDFLHSTLVKENFSLSFKEGVVMFLMTNYFPEVLLGYKELHSIKFGKELSNLKEFRNHIAHRNYLGKKDENFYYIEIYGTQEGYRDIKQLPLNDEIIMDTFTRAARLLLILNNLTVRVLDSEMPPLRVPKPLEEEQVERNREKQKQQSSKRKKP